MKRYDVVVCYDISDPKRLKKILFDATQQELNILLESITKIYNQEQDDIRVYKIKQKGIHMGSAIDLENPYDFF